MKIRTLLYGLSTIVLGGIAMIYYQNDFNRQESNATLTFSSAKPAPGIKGALEYYHLIKANPATGEISKADYVAARKGALQMPTSKAMNLQWTEMGPSNVGGRTRAILIDNSNSSVMYAGGVSGGLWKSTTSGQSWTKIPLDDNIAISCIAQAPDGTIYVGTGEGLANATGTNFNSGQYGNGIYKSTDGNTFTLLSSTSSFNFVNRIAVDKNNKVFIATSSGLKSSTDGGNTWNPEKPGNFKDVKIAPNSTQVVASVNGTVYISNDAQTQWNTPTGLSASGSIRVEIGIAPSDPNYIYLVYVASNGKLNAIYQADSAGADLAWRKIGIGGSPSFELFGPNQQGWYDAAILVSPSNPELIFVGGISIWRGQSAMAGAPFSWTQISSLGKYYGDGSPNPHYVHADVHTLVQNPNNPSGFFVGCDGGIFETDNNGTTFTSKNINYAVTQMYAVACDPSGWAAGGTQDNSTPYVDGSGNNPKEARVLYSGDGGWAAFSSLNQKMIFATSQVGFLGRSDDRGETWQRPTTNAGAADYFNDDMINSGASGSSAWVTPQILWETRSFPNSIDSVSYVPDTTYSAGDTVWVRSLKNASYPFPYVLTQNVGTDDILRIQDPIKSRLFFGAHNAVYMTQEPLYYGGGTPVWFKLATVAGNVNTMALSKDGDMLLFAVNNTLYRLSNLLAGQDSSTLQVGQSNYALQFSSIKNFSGIITSIAIDPMDANRVVVTLGGFSSSYPHVYYSQDATGNSPTFVAKAGNLPSSLPVYASLIPMNNSSQVIIGTEYGIMGTENILSGNPTWTDQSTGIDDKVPVFMLRQQIYQQPWLKAGRWDGGNMVYQVFPGIYNYGEIYAGTHGRGIFKCTDYVGFKEIDKNSTSFKSELKVYPNPAHMKTNIAYELNQSEEVRLSVYDIHGRFIKAYNLGRKAAGKQKATLNLDNLSSGVYMLQLKAGKQSKTGKIVVR